MNLGEGPTLARVLETHRDWLLDRHHADGTARFG